MNLKSGSRPTRKPRSKSAKRRAQKSTARKATRIATGASWPEARPAGGALEVREERDLTEVGDAPAPAVAARHQRVAPGGVHQHRRPRSKRTVLGARGHGHAAGVELGALHGGRLVHGDAALLRVVEQHGVEVGAGDLVGIVRPRLARQEIERLRRAVVLLVDEARAVLDLEAELLDRRLRAELLQQEHRGGQQRPADLEAPESLALEERHAQSPVGQEGCRARAARPAAYHDDVEGLHQALLRSGFTLTGTGAPTRASSRSCA